MDLFALGMILLILGMILVSIASLTNCARGVDFSVLFFHILAIVILITSLILIILYYPNNIFYVIT